MGKNAQDRLGLQSNVFALLTVWLSPLLRTGLTCRAMPCLTSVWLSPLLRTGMACGAIYFSVLTIWLSPLLRIDLVWPSSPVDGHFI